MSQTSSMGLADRALNKMVRFFKAEWSGALVAILILAISIIFSHVICHGL